MRSDQRHFHEPRVTVEERRAPTDDSIRLASEFEEKIKSRILDTLILKDNHLEATLVRMVDAPLSPVIYICFSLNGEKHKVRAPLDMDLKLLDRESVIKLVSVAFTAAVARALMAHMEGTKCSF